MKPLLRSWKREELQRQSGIALVVASKTMQVSQTDRRPIPHWPEDGDTSDLLMVAQPGYEPRLTQGLQGAGWRSKAQRRRERRSTWSKQWWCDDHELPRADLHPSTPRSDRQVTEVGPAPWWASLVSRHTTEAEQGDSGKLSKAKLMGLQVEIDQMCAQEDAMVIDFQNKLAQMRAQKEAR